jgi:WD40 repeat protein
MPRSGFRGLREHSGYAAFISYSHAADGEFAPQMQRALQSFAKPWYGFGGLRVYRDETSLAISPALWNSIQSALEESEFFILLASPEGAQSPWVAQEVGYWLAHKSPNTLLIVLTEGSLSWDKATRDFDWSQTNALPDNLRSAFKEEPLYLDLKWARGAERLSPNHPEFRLAVAKIAANLCHCSVDKIASEDVRQRQIFRRVTALTVIFLVLLLAFAVYSAWRAIVNGRIADNRRIISVAQALAAEAGQERRDAGDHERAALFARQAFLFNEELHGSEFGTIDAALRRVAEPAYFAMEMGPVPGELNLAAASPDSRWIAATDTRGKIWLFDLHAHDAAPRLFPAAPAPLRTLVFSVDSRQILALTEDSKAIVWSSFEAGPKIDITPISGAEALSTVAAVSGSGLIAAAREDGAILIWTASNFRAEPRILCCDPEGITAMSFRPFSEDLVSSSGDGRLRLWNAKGSSAPIAVSPAVPAAISAVAYRSDGELIAIATNPVFARSLSALIRGVSTEPSRPMESPNSVFVWDPGHPQSNPKRIGEQDGAVSTLAFTPDGRQVAALSPRSRAISLWNIKGPEARNAELRSENALRSIAVTDDPQLLASAEAVEATGGAQSFLRIWRLRPSPATPVVERLYSDLDPVVSVDFNPSDDTIASAAHQAATLWNPATGGVKRLDHADADVMAVAFSPDGKGLASGSKSMPGFKHDFSLRLWSSSNWEAPCGRYNDHGSSVQAVAFSLNGMWVASAGLSDGVIRLRPGQCSISAAAVRKVESNGEIHCIKFGTGSQLVWGSGDGSLSFLDISQAGSSATRIPAHQGRYIQLHSITLAS